MVVAEPLLDGEAMGSLEGEAMGQDLGMGIVMEEEVELGMVGGI